jgi:predicted aconitase
MLLTDTEKRMLDGDKGYPVQKSMQILVALGESCGAEKMLEVDNIHMPGASIVVAGTAGRMYVEEMQAKGGNFCAFTMTNPTAMDSSQWEQLGIDEKDAQEQTLLTTAYERMGAVTCATCTPYLIGNVPRLGQHISWGESSAVAFANSVLGARTNREGGPSALAAALTGRVPAYGFHLAENRYGKLLVRVTTPLAGTTDYGTLGYYVGAIAKQDTPVISGIPRHASLDELKCLGAALASSGAVALFHVVEVTPEAPTVEAAFGGKRPGMELEFGPAEKRKTEELLNKERSGDVDWIALGCPHLSIQEFRQLAEALHGKRVHREVTLWACSSVPVKAMAEKMGYAQIIREAGGILVCETCPVLAPTRELAQKMGYRTVTTNSAKMAHYSPGMFGLLTHYGQFDQIIDAAISRVWRE